VIVLLAIGLLGSAAINLVVAGLLSWPRTEDDVDTAGFLCVVALLWVTVFSLVAVIAGMGS